MRKFRIFIFALGFAAAVQAAAAQSALIDGQVTKVDQSGGKVTIKHGPIKKLGMDEGMTMVFRAQDPAMAGESVGNGAVAGSGLL